MVDLSTVRAFGIEPHRGALVFDSQATLLGAVWPALRGDYAWRHFSGAEILHGIASTFNAAVELATHGQPPALRPWSSEDDAASRRHGWALFTAAGDPLDGLREPDGTVRIQRLDGDAPMLADDTAAWRRVVGRAVLGMEREARALSLVSGAERRKIFAYIAGLQMWLTRVEPAAAPRNGAFYWVRQLPGQPWEPASYNDNFEGQPWQTIGTDDSIAVYEVGPEIVRP